MIRYILALLIPFSVFSQAEKPQNGVKAPDQNSFVLTNVTILVSPDKTIENGTITVRNGKIVSVEKFSLTNPKDLQVIDGNQAIVVPSFIEVNSTLGIQQDQKAENKPDHTTGIMPSAPILMRWTGLKQTKNSCPNTRKWASEQCLFTGMTDWPKDMHRSFSWG